MEHDDRAEAFLATVARALQVERGRLHLGTTRDDVKEWDSLAHLLIFMELEREYGVSFSTEDVGKYSALAQIYERVGNR